jgi:hypothetical protein
MMTLSIKHMKILAVAATLGLGLSHSAKADWGDHGGWNGGDGGWHDSDHWRDHWHHDHDWGRGYYPPPPVYYAPPRVYYVPPPPVYVAPPPVYYTQPGY